MNPNNDYARAAKTELKRMLAVREEAKASVRARLAARDALYAASPFAAKVEFVIRTRSDGARVLIETRGQRVCGWCEEVAR